MDSEVAWTFDVVASTGKERVEPLLPKVMDRDADRVEGRRGVVRSLKMEAVSDAALVNELELARATSVTGAALRDHD